MPTVIIHKKILMNNGKSILLSELNNYITENQREFTSLKNWFKYDDFINMVNQMNWISNVRVNEGENVLNMNIVDFKKFMNKTFEMNFKFKNENLNENNNENNNSDNKNDDNNNNKNNKNNQTQKQNQNQNQNQNQKNEDNNQQNGKSKFHGSRDRNFGNMNNNNHKRKNQMSIMEAMGARLREMVTSANTNNIHDHVKRPTIPMAKNGGQNVPVYYSDNFGFSKFRFYNPYIKDFSIELLGNLTCIYRSKIDPQRRNFSRDLKTAINRAPIGKACIFVEGNIFIPFRCITEDMVQFNVGDPIEKSNIPYGMSGIGDILDYQNISSEHWMLGIK